MRSVRIESTEEFLNDMSGSGVQIIDAETKVKMDNVQAIGIVISLDDAVWARLTCVKMQDDAIHCATDADGNLIEYEEDVLVQSIHIG